MTGYKPRPSRATFDLGFLPADNLDFDRVFAQRFERVVQRDNTVQFENRRLQLPKLQGVATLAGRKVEVRKRLDVTLEILVGHRRIVVVEADEDIENCDQKYAS